MDDTLPALDKVLRSKLTFDLVWLSGVWMHVPPSTRGRAFRKLVSVMSPGGSMMVSLRQGPPPAERPVEPATAAEVDRLWRDVELAAIGPRDSSYLETYRRIRVRRIRVPRGRYRGRAAG